MKKCYNEKCDDYTPENDNNCTHKDPVEKCMGYVCGVVKMVNGSEIILVGNCKEKLKGSNDSNFTTIW